ncbi:MAG: (Fe-S)-binding protein [Fimbriimonas sp.]
MNPTREEFLTLSGPEKVLFYVLILASLAVLGLQVAERFKVWRQGRPLGPPDPKLWAKRIVTDILGQRKVRSSRPSSGAPMHLAIFYGFLALLIATTLLAINTYSPVKFHQGQYFLVYEMAADLLGLLFVVGLAWALGRRLLDRSTPISRDRTDLFALTLLLLIGLTGYWLEAARMSLQPKPFDWSAPVGHALSGLQGPVSGQFYRFVWWFHAIWVMVFIAIIPRLRLRHILLAVASTAARPEKPMGRLDPVSLEEVEQTGQLGTVAAKDLSRWQLLSVDACMECGRCTEVCPAWNAGKILNPKQVVQDVRAAMTTGATLADKIGEESLWACTTCNACVEACPVHINHVDLIVDTRRNLVFEGKLRGSGATMLRQAESTGHAWGQAASAREEWMKGLNIPLCRDGGQFDILFWVGCAGATDPAAVKTTRAVAQLMQKAGIRFACLGREEACTGDPARRVGEELLYQDKASQNAEKFRKYGVTKVVTTCPHCLNTLQGEYTDQGLTLDVLHHTQLLNQLVSRGDLLAAKPQKGEVVFHDPCYLGRVRGESDAPRALLSDGQVEPELKREKTRCCGAGGGRMWMEEAPDQRPSDRRTQQLLATGAKTVAVGCPFCRIMLDASVRQASEDVRLVDVAELVLDANSQ